MWGRVGVGVAVRVGVAVWVWVWVSVWVASHIPPHPSPLIPTCVFLKGLPCSTSAYSCGRACPAIWMTVVTLGPPRKDLLSGNIAWRLRVLKTRAPSRTPSACDGGMGTSGGGFG